MSSLSSLLNPAPSSHDAGSNDPSPPAPLLLDGQDHRKATQRPESGVVQSPLKHNSISSPGLEALAAVASHIAPLTSPTSQDAFGDRHLNQQSMRNYHAPTADMMGGIQNNAGPMPTASLEHYHHNGHNERQSPKDNEDTPKPLAPYQSTLPHDADQTAGLNLKAPTAATFSHSLPPISTTQFPQPDNFTHAVQDELISPKNQSFLEASQPHQEQIELKAEVTTDADNIELGTHDQPVSNGALKANDQSSISPPKSTETDVAAVMPQIKQTKRSHKKRPAASKKGTAANPPANKKRKLEEDTNSTPRTGTPATHRGSNTPVPKSKKQQSATPTRSSSIANGQDEDDYDDEDEVFCICRKPDDHTIMIGCDGPCEDWFHTKCVDMNQEKVELIFKWYCPNCAALGHETLWKRMCRLEGCSKPAKTEGVQSKYCCREHGLEFMSRLVDGEVGPSAGNKTGRRKSRKDTHTDNAGNAMDASNTTESMYEGARGGVLSPEELKALVDGVRTVEEFHNLGNGVLSPPATTSPDDTEGTSKPKMTYTQDEETMLAEISQKIQDLHARKDMLGDRDKLISMVTVRGKAVATELKQKDKTIKDICGYDARLTWSDYELNEWRASEVGKEALSSGILPADPAAVEKALENAAGGEGPETAPGVCKKKRCERHKAWLKLQQQDNAMEKNQVRQDLVKLSAEEKVVKDRAMIRFLEEGEGTGTE